MGQLAIKTEKQLWQAIRRIWCEEWQDHGVRIEASEGGCDPGTPDTNLSAYGRGCWVELKVWPEPISPIQVAWHVDAEARGATCWVISYMGNALCWIGKAEDYQSYIDRKERPSKTIQLSIRSALVSIREMLV